MSARKGSVCPPCWDTFTERADHDPAQCHGEWDDTTSPNGRTVCVCCGTRKRALATATTT